MWSYLWKQEPSVPFRDGSCPTGTADLGGAPSPSGCSGALTSLWRRLAVRDDGPGSRIRGGWLSSHDGQVHSHRLQIRRQLQHLELQGEADSAVLRLLGQQGLDAPVK